MPAAYETAQADRWDADLTDADDDQPEAQESSALRHAHALLAGR